METKGSKKIKNAFIELLKEKRYTDISIQDIADYACISRRSFYLHYESKLQLFEEMMGDFIEFYLNPFVYDDASESFADKIRRVIQCVKENHEFAQTLFHESCPQVADKQICIVLNNQINSEKSGFFLKQFCSSRTQKYYVEVVSANLVAAIHFMLDNQHLSLDDCLKEICSVCDMISHFYYTNFSDVELSNEQKSE